MQDPAFLVQTVWYKANAQYLFADIKNPLLNDVRGRSDMFVLDRTVRTRLVWFGDPVWE